MPKLSDATPVGSLAERLASLNDGDMFLPASFLQEVVCPYIIGSFLFVSILYILALNFIGLFLPKDTDLAKKRKFSYQLTNFCANIVLGASGVYMQYWMLSPDLTPEEKSQGHEEFVFVSCFQLGYNFWAIPVGLIYVNESAPMLAHHVAVIAVSTMTGFLRNGFRYWTPFFYGMIELSSVPLAIMNFFKDNPSLVKRYPGFYSNIRNVFAFSFLWLRIYMFTPRLMEYLHHQYLVYSSHPSAPYRIFMATCWASSFFLQVLQVYWAALIVKGVLKQFFRPGKKQL